MITPEQHNNYGRIWADGCFDLMHYGHANALRQARELGDFLAVGVHSDADIEKHKGPTVMLEKERYEAVRACKWVDLVVEGAPYCTVLEVLNQHNIDYCVHGEDISVDENGRNSYQEIIDAGKFMLIKRTEGVSTTDVVRRILQMGKTPSIEEKESEANQVQSPYTTGTSFIATTRQIVQFASGRTPKPGDKIVYVHGAFDLFHAGHISTLKQAKALGDFLIVGIHDDNAVRSRKGKDYPIMSLHERVLSVLQCRYVDEVVIGAPSVINKELLDALKITIVVQGSVQDAQVVQDDADAFKIPKELGLYKEVKSEFPELTTSVVVERIIENHLRFEERNRKKQAKELRMLALEEERQKQKH